MDIIKINHERITGIDGDFYAGQVKGCLRELLRCDYPRSIYESTASRMSERPLQPPFHDFMYGS